MPPRVFAVMVPLLLSLAAAAAPPVSPMVLRVNGSTTVSPVVAAAAEVLRRERGLAITVDTEGGSSGGLAALGEGRGEMAMSSRPVLDDDRARYPGVDFRPHRIGVDAVALVVSRDVWEGGLRSLSPEEVRALYEGRVRNWKELGGPDRRVVFFNKEPGRGTWEVFAHWLYGDARKAPLVSLPEVGSNQEGRNKVASTPGAVTQLSASWADGETIFALAVELPGGSTVAPTASALASGQYPLARSLFVVTAGPPAGAGRELVDFLLGPRGQALVERNGYLGVAALVTGAVP